jgi:hypothetical protein
MAAALPGDEKGAATPSGGGAFSGLCTEANCPVPAVGAPPTSSACVPQILGSSAASAAQIPAGFNNQATRDDGVDDVILATPSLDYTPGETVDIYARVVDDATRTVSLPCTVLAGPELGGAGAALGVPVTATPATPAGTSIFSGQSVLEVVVPGTAVAGESYQIAVQVPAGDGEAQAKEVTLTIEVS